MHLMYAHLSVCTSDVRTPDSCFYVSRLDSFDCGNEF